jgi:hypothetical protein
VRFSVVHQFMAVRLQVLCLFLAWLLYWSSMASGRTVAIIFGGIGYLAFSIFQLVCTVFYLYSSKNKSLLTTHVVEVQDQAFYEETPFNRSFHYWPGIARVVRRPGFAAVYNSAVVAHIIPRRAFAGDQQVDQFVAQVDERIRAAQQTG